jgi:peptide subunit release factor 1 (eRF1)
VVWLEALESMTQSVTAGGTILMVWKEWASSCWSQELIHGVHITGVEAPGATRRSGQPVAEEDRRRERQSSSTVSMPSEVEVPGAT